MNSPGDKTGGRGEDVNRLTRRGAFAGEKRQRRRVREASSAVMPLWVEDLIIEECAVRHAEETPPDPLPVWVEELILQKLKKDLSRGLTK